MSKQAVKNKPSSIDANRLTDSLVNASIAPAGCCDRRPQPEPGLKDTLDKIKFRNVQDHQFFQEFVGHYGTMMVAHAVMFQRAAEVVAGHHTEQSFKRSLEGNKPPSLQFQVKRPLVGSLREIAKEVYIPRCAFKTSFHQGSGSDVAIPFLDSDLANLFVELSNDIEGRKISNFMGGKSHKEFADFTYRVRTLKQLLEPKTVVKGLAFTAEGFERAIATYEFLRQREGSRGPEEGALMIDYYSSLVNFYCSRGNEIMRHSRF